MHNWLAKHYRKIRLCLVTLGALGWLVLMIFWHALGGTMSLAEEYLAPIYSSPVSRESDQVRSKAQALIAEGGQLSTKMWLLDHWFDTLILGAATSCCLVLTIESSVNAVRQLQTNNFDQEEVVAGTQQ